MPLFRKFFPSNVMTFTSDRTVDFTVDEHQSTFNELQREFLSAQLKLGLSEPVYIRQVHGDKVLVIGQEFPQTGIGIREADGLLTKICNLPLAIRSADCLPVFLYDEKQMGIGLIHVGWRGCQKNIVGQAVKLMIKEWQSDPVNIQVLFGPSIRSCCYETGKEFLKYFPQSIALRNGKHYLDLVQANQNQLASLGILKENILDCGICTCCDKNFFSHRREGKLSGRMISLIMLNEDTAYGRQRE